MPGWVTIRVSAVPNTCPEALVQALMTFGCAEEFSVDGGIAA